MGSFIVTGPSPGMATYQLQVTSAPNPQMSTHPDSCVTPEHQQQQQLSPNSASSSGGEGCSTPNGTTTVMTQDSQPMMIQTAGNVNSQLVQIAQPTQQLYMPMQAAVQQPRVVAVRTPQGRENNFFKLILFFCSRWSSTFY
jgi:hypothetical protein